MSGRTKNKEIISAEVPLILKKVITRYGDSQGLSEGEVIRLSLHLFFREKTILMDARSDAEYKAILQNDDN